ncbi:HNH endonuclease signature motif containing protein [Frankia sp. EAN1pec]|uniref:HNH endonuclease n=1 Tax=Parafrankia sp. (strain EAN1pec) TaxID=298653 RepID=UPI00005412FB
MARTATPASQRFSRHVDKSGGPGACWPWTGGKMNSGYGVFRPSKDASVLAHRWAYEQVNGTIPRGLHIDHTCHNGTGCPPGRCPHCLCCNPAHLEAVTPGENLNRSHNGNAAKVVCRAGHPYSKENTYIGPSGNRFCRQCMRASSARRSPGPRVLRPIDPEEVKHLYELGWGAARIRDHLGVSLPRLYRSFDELGLPRRPVGRPPRKVA